jgi:pterin-4a-carbinolamine dehydratase
MAADIMYSAGEDAEQLGGQLESLLTHAGGRWALSKDKRGLERDFRFKTFKITWVG